MPLAFAGEEDYECFMASEWIFLLISMPTWRSKFILEQDSWGEAESRI